MYKKKERIIYYLQIYFLDTSIPLNSKPVKVKFHNIKKYKDGLPSRRFV